MLLTVKDSCVPHPSIPRFDPEPASVAAHLMTYFANGGCVWAAGPSTMATSAGQR